MRRLRLAASAYSVAMFSGAFCLLVCHSSAKASTYVVYLPLDWPIYRQLDTLNGLGLLDTYLPRYARSAASRRRLTLEAQRHLVLSEPAIPLTFALHLIRSLPARMPDEIRWIETNHEDNVPLLVAHPIDRVEAQYVYSQGERRAFGPLDRFGERLRATETTPLLPDNDDLPTSAGSNEVLRASSSVGTLASLQHTVKVRLPARLPATPRDRTVRLTD